MPLFHDEERTRQRRQSLRHVPARIIPGGRRLDEGAAAGGPAGAGIINQNPLTHHQAIGKNGGCMSVMIFVTGGTFDKEYNELDGSLYFNDTHLAEMLKLARCETAHELRTLMMMDSRDMTEADRKIILDNCKSTPHSKIVITHGTDTMVETAKLLAAHLQNKTVVLTGAMIPYKFGSSDGMFNLGQAIAYSKSMPHGVYIAMNGHCFNHDNVRKNKAKGKFERIRPDLEK